VGPLRLSPQPRDVAKRRWLFGGELPPQLRRPPPPSDSPAKMVVQSKQEQGGENLLKDTGACHRGWEPTSHPILMLSLAYSVVPPAGWRFRGRDVDRAHEKV